MVTWRQVNKPFRVAFLSVSEQVLVHNLSNGNEFDFQDNQGVRKTHFHMEGCAPRLVLRQREKET